MFEVVLATPKNKDEAKPKKERATPKWEAEGIKIRKYMLHPTCPFCGLEDLGKEAPIRPDRNHMLNCEKRTLDPYPMRHIAVLDEEGKETGEFQTKGRVGSFVGERITRQLRIPVRLVRPIPIKDDDGNEIPELDDHGSPTGRGLKRFLCSYYWKEENVHDWVWNGEKWVEWFKWNEGPAGTSLQTPLAYRWDREGGWQPVSAS